MKRCDRRTVFVELLERRQLLSTNWGVTARLVHQDTAAADFASVTGKGVTIALVDTGIDYNDPQLGGGFGPGHKVIGGWDFVDNDANPMDTYGHGTEVAGIIAADGFTYNGQHYQGIAPDAKLVALRIAKDGGGIADQTMDKALKWIETNYKTYGISIVNISFGSGQYSQPLHNPTLSDDFAKLAGLGILTVSVSGNEGVSPLSQPGVAYPGADANVEATGSINPSGQISDFSERGSLMDLLAPGEDVPTTIRGGGIGTGSGTSFSAPFVTGAAALLKQVDPSLKGPDMLSILRASGDPLRDTTTVLNLPTVNHYPILNIDQAIRLADGRKAANDPPVGQSGITSDLAYDAQGVLHFAYYDSAKHALEYATRSTEGQWSAIEQVDPTKHDVGAFLSLAIDATGRPAIAYYDATTKDLKYAWFDGTRWLSQRVDSSKSVGQFPSLAFDKEGTARIAYYRKTSGDLRMLRFDGTSWLRQSVDMKGKVGISPSIAVSDSGTVAIAYEDATHGDLKYASLENGTWSYSVIDDLNGVSDISLVFNPQRNPAMSYYNAGPADLKFAQYVSGKWQKETVARGGLQGQYSTLFYDDSAKAHLIYYNRSSNSLNELSGSIGAWTLTTLVSGGGQFANAAITDDGMQSSYVYYSPDLKELLVEDLT